MNHGCNFCLCQFQQWVWRLSNPADTFYGSTVLSNLYWNFDELEFSVELFISYLCHVAKVNYVWAAWTIRADIHCFISSAPCFLNHCLHFHIIKVPFWTWSISCPFPLRTFSSWGWIRIELTANRISCASRFTYLKLFTINFDSFWEKI